MPTCDRSGSDVGRIGEERIPRVLFQSEREVQRVNVDFPVGPLRAIDREARRIGVTGQAFIKRRGALWPHV
jgi:hypothetical protein